MPHRRKEPAPRLGVALLSLPLVLACGCSLVPAKSLHERDQIIRNLGDEVVQLRSDRSTLQQQLAARTMELQTAQGEIAQERSRRGTRRSPSSGEVALARQVEGLKNDLDRERQRRQSLEAELERIVQEAGSPYGDSAQQDPEYLALKQELLDLRRAAEEERQTREKLSEDLVRLQQAPATKSGPRIEPAQVISPPPPGLADSRALPGLASELEASRRHATELEVELGALRSGQREAEVLRTENNTLKASLEDERQRISDLEGKLRAASKVADLIFRLQSQQAGGAPNPVQGL